MNQDKEEKDFEDIIDNVIKYWVGKTFMIRCGGIERGNLLRK